MYAVYHEFYWTCFFTASTSDAVFVQVCQFSHDLPLAAFRACGILRFEGMTFGQGYIVAGFGKALDFSTSGRFFEFLANWLHLLSDFNRNFPNFVWSRITDTGDLATYVGRQAISSVGSFVRFLKPMQFFSDAAITGALAWVASSATSVLTHCSSKTTTSAKPLLKKRSCQEIGPTIFLGCGISLYRARCNTIQQPRSRQLFCCLVHNQLWLRKGHVMSNAHNHRL